MVEREDTDNVPEDEAVEGQSISGQDLAADEEPLDETGGNDPIRLPIEDTLDLHSFRPDEVASVVEEYLREAQAAGFLQVRIIHGRGIGVQREIVRAVLARTPFVVSFADAPPGGGGWGATVAHLTRRDEPI